MSIDKETVKKIGIFACIVILFMVLSYGFMPQILGGKVVNQSDITGFQSMARQASEWNRLHPDDPTYWTDSMFGGMPTTAFMPEHSGDYTNFLYKILLLGKRPATYLFISLLGAFLLMLSLGIDTILAIGGAIAVTFCSYNIQIIQVGHNTKMQALAFLPWVLAAVIFTYRSALRKGKGRRSWLPATILGSVLFGLALSMQVKANHPQITYYLAILLAIYVVTEFIWIVAFKARRSSTGRFFAASALLLIAGLAGIGTNAVKLAPLYEYQQYTMRGGSELGQSSDSTSVNAKGLQLDYATAWSYGWEELPNLMIPNYNGGSSNGGLAPEKSATVSVFRQLGEENAAGMADYMPYYWGPQPFTSGPMYMGAIIIFLFFLGLFLYEGREKWWILAATIVAVCLGLGSNMMWFTRFFFEHVPVYNKFRTVSMAITLLQFTLPMLGFLTLDRILKNEYPRKALLSSGWAAFALTAGYCLLMILVPSIAGSFVSPSDLSFPDKVVGALISDRKYLLVSDAMRSLLFISGAFALVLWCCRKSSDESHPENAPITGSVRNIAAAAIGILVLIDLFTVGHRYLGEKDFITPRAFKGQFAKRPVDEAILADTTLSYRVADLTASVFNDSFNPYWHKAIGGYSPAKLQRYQDLIDRHLAPEISDVISGLSSVRTYEDLDSVLDKATMLNVLNTKYFVISPDVEPLENPFAYGNAWFVDSLVSADTPDQEIDTLGHLDLRRQIVVGKDFTEAGQSVQEALALPSSEEDCIFMTSYAPNRLVYRYSAKSSRPAVFSEIFYPKGWTATVDGEPVDLFRCDWTLRAAVLPAGEHEVEMKYAPDIYSKGRSISATSSILLYLLLAGSAAGLALGGKKEE